MVVVVVVVAVVVVRFVMMALYIRHGADAVKRGADSTAARRTSQIPAAAATSSTLNSVKLGRRRIVTAGPRWAHSAGSDSSE